LSDLRAQITSPTSSLFDIQCFRDLLSTLASTGIDNIEYDAQSKPMESPLSLYSLLPSQGRLLCDLDNVEQETEREREDFDDTTNLGKIEHYFVGFLLLNGYVV
jgi:hypothetical protein